MERENDERAGSWESIVCPSCGGEVAKGMRFCLYCGEPLTSIDPSEALQQQEKSKKKSLQQQEKSKKKLIKSIVALVGVCTVFVLGMVLYITVGWRTDFVARMQSREKKIGETIGNESFAFVLIEDGAGKKLTVGKYYWEDDSDRPLIWYHGIIENREEGSINLNNLHTALYTDGKKLSKPIVRFFERKDNGQETSNVLTELAQGKQADFYVIATLNKDGEEKDGEMLISYTGALGKMGVGKSYLVSYQ